MRFDAVRISYRVFHVVLTQYALSDMRKLFASILCLLAIQTVRIPFSQISPQSLF